MGNFRLKAGIIALVVAFGIAASSFALARAPGRSYSNNNMPSGNNLNLASTNTHYYMPLPNGFPLEVKSLEMVQIAKRHTEYTMVLKGLGVRTDLLFTPFIAYLQTGEFPENAQEIFLDPNWMFTDQNRQDIEKLLDSGDVIGAAVLTANIVFATGTGSSQSNPKYDKSTLTEDDIPENVVQSLEEMDDAVCHSIDNIPDIIVDDKTYCPCRNLKGDIVYLEENFLNQAFPASKMTLEGFATKTQVTSLNNKLVHIPFFDPETQDYTKGEDVIVLMDNKKYCKPYL